MAAANPDDKALADDLAKAKQRLAGIKPGAAEPAAEAAAEEAAPAEAPAEEPAAE